MTQLTSLGPAFKDAFFTAATNLYSAAATQVAFGHPGQRQADEIVAFMEFNSEAEPVTLGTRRQFNEVVNLTVLISVWQGGGDAATEKSTSDRALAILGDLENYARVTNTTFDGLLLYCYRTSYQVTTTPDEFLASGRLTEISAVFTAVGRIIS